MEKAKLLLPAMLATVTMTALVALAPIASATNLGLAAKQDPAGSTANAGVARLLQQAQVLLTVRPAGGGAPSDLANATIASATTLLNGVVTTLGILAGSVSEGLDPSSIDATTLSQESAVLYQQAAIFAQDTGKTGADVGSILWILDQGLDHGIL